MDAQAHLVGIPVADLAERWAEALPFIKNAAERSSGKFAVEDIVRALRAGHFQLWGAELGARLIAAGMTEIVNYPKRRVCRGISWSGEDRARWMHCLLGIETWARSSEGAAAMEILARPGWATTLKAQGYRVTHLLFEKEL